MHKRINAHKANMDIMKPERVIGLNLLPCAGHLHVTI